MRTISRPLVLLTTTVLTTACAKVITPIGPFCPFRSSACSDSSPLGAAMSKLTSDRMPRFAAEMGRLQLQMQTGGQPDVNKVRELADELVEAEAEWQSMLVRMRLAEDFQSREYFKLTAAWAEKQGESLESVGLMMKWQAENMKAFAMGMPPFPPPPGVDLEKLAKQQEEQMRGGGGGPGSMTAQLNAASQVDAVPFTGREKAFESEVVKSEYESICRSHDSIIKMGEKFGTFDPLGKIAFLDALEAVEERWDVFFGRFALMGELNQEFVEQTTTFLEALGMSVEEYRTCLNEAHDLMRADAEAERQRQP